MRIFLCSRNLSYAASGCDAAFVAAAWALDPHQSLRHYGYQSWQTDSGLPQNTVHAVLQTSDGYIWLATEAGLVRFDSVKFTVFTRKRHTATGKRSRYFALGGQVRTLCGSAPRTASPAIATAYSSAFPNTSGRSVWSIFQDREGSVWVMTSAGLLRSDGSRFSRLPAFRRWTKPAACLSRGDGSLWLSTTEGLFHAAPMAVAAASAFTRPARAVSRRFRPSRSGRKGRVWAGTQSGLEICGAAACEAIHSGSRDKECARAGRTDARRHLDRRRCRPCFYDQRARRRRCDSTHEGRSAIRPHQLLFCDREGALWIGTVPEESRVSSMERSKSFTPREGFSSNAVLSIVEDREGNLWLGTESGGVDILRDRKFTTYTAQDGISDDHILAVTRTMREPCGWEHSGGGLDHAISRPSTKTASPRSQQPMDSPATSCFPSPARPTAIYGWELRTGLTACTTGKSTCSPRPTAWRTTSCARSISTRRARSGSARAAASRNSRTENSPLGPPSTDWAATWWARCCKRGTARMWISTLGGLTQLEQRHFRNYTEKDGLSNRVITALHQDADGTLWIGTNRRRPQPLAQRSIQGNPSRKARRCRQTSTAFSQTTPAISGSARTKASTAPTATT